MEIIGIYPNFVKKCNKLGNFELFFIFIEKLSKNCIKSRT